MRAAIVFIALILYLVSFNLYLYNLVNPNILPENIKTWYSLMTGGILLFFAIDGWNGYVSQWHDVSAKILLITVLTNFLIIVCVHKGILVDAWWQMITFNLTWLIINTMVLISCIRNGVFDKQ